MKFSEIEQLYKALLAEQETQAEAREAQDLAAKAAIVTNEILPLIIPALAQKTGVDEDELSAATTIHADQWTQYDLDEPNLGHLCNFSIVISVPEHADIAMSNNHADKMDGAIGIALCNYRSPWIVRDNTADRLDYLYDDFDEALWMAARVWADEQEYQRDHAEQEAACADREEHQAAIAEMERRRRHTLINQLMMDRVAFHLLQVMVEVTQDRAAWQEALDHANDCQTKMEEAYGARLSRAEQSARDAQCQSGFVTALKSNG